MFYDYLLQGSNSKFIFLFSQNSPFWVSVKALHFTQRWKVRKVSQAQTMILIAICVKSRLEVGGGGGVKGELYQIHIFKVPSHLINLPASNLFFIMHLGNILSVISHVRFLLEKMSIFRFLVLTPYLFRWILKRWMGIMLIEFFVFR